MRGPSSGRALSRRASRVADTAGRALRYVRSRGVRKSVRRLWERYVFASQGWVVFANPLEGPPVDSGGDGIVFRPCSPQDLTQLTAFEPYASAAELRARLGEGCWLDLAWDGVRPVAFRIVSPGGPRGVLGRVVRLRRDQVWVVDVFCLPEYRGRGIAARLGLCMDRRIGTLGYREGLSANRIDNRRAVRLSLAQGDQPIYAVSYVRVLTYVKYRMIRDVERVLQAAGLVTEIAARNGSPPTR